MSHRHIPISQRFPEDLKLYLLLRLFVPELEQVGRREGEFRAEGGIGLSKLLPYELGKQGYAVLGAARHNNYKGLMSIYPEFESRPCTIAGISIRGEN